MQGKTNGSSERKGPHKSMHCKFCKPPGVIVEDKAAYPQLETKTKIHLVHEGADLKIFDVHDEPGMPAVEYEACVCVLEGDKACPKCVPDKTRPPQKKTVCRCPKGAKPHPTMYDPTPVQKKEEDQDDEFWWEKYSREHDALAKETWAAYMAHRKKEKKLIKCQKQEELAALIRKYTFKPNWFQKLSCQQVLYVEYLSTAVRLDSDENVTDRTYFILGGLGLYPRPARKIIKKCLKFCQYNTLQFLNQLLLLTKDNVPFNEKRFMVATDAYSWNEALIMNAVCHLELPAVLREIMDRMPPLPRDEILPQIPYPVFRKPKKIKYESPYDEPLWKDGMNWVEKRLIDKMNRARAHMENKRVKIPPLALVRRPSLIDNRPPFLAQIEANEKASRRLVKEKPKKVFRKHHISTFNSAVDVTAIAGIAASDVSTTDKADTDDICVFLREPKRQDMAEEDREPEELIATKEVRFTDEEEENTQVNRIKDFSLFGEYSGEEDLPFKTPPKRESGTTIQSPCPPPDTTPGPPVTHYERAKREMGIITQDLCAFHPMVSSSTQTVKDSGIFKEEDVEEKLKSAAEKLKQFADEPEEEEADKLNKKKERKKKSGKKHKKTKKRKRAVVEMPHFSKEEEEEEENEEEGEKESELLKDDDLLMRFTDEEEQGETKSVRSKSIRSRKPSEISDPDPDPDAEWPPRPICLLDEEEEEEKPKKKKCRRKKCRLKKKRLMKKKKKKKKKESIVDMVLREESNEYLKKWESTEKEDKVTMTECYPGEYDYLYKEAREEREGKESEKKKPETEVYTGNPKVLVKNIIKDLAEEGFLCASYRNLCEHEDVQQLILYLKGKIITKKVRDELYADTKLLWNKSKGVFKSFVPPIKISPEKIKTFTWNDKKWLSRLAKKKIDEAYFSQAFSRASAGKEVFMSLHWPYMGTDRYLKAYYAYMVSKYEDCVLKGV